MFVNYSTDDWTRTDWDSTKVASKIALARKNVNRILYKDWFTASVTANAAAMRTSIDDSATAIAAYTTLTADAATNTYTCYELLWIVEKNKINDLTTTSPIATTKWFAATTVS